jgi:hypothetical protein
MLAMAAARRRRARDSAASPAVFHGPAERIHTMLNESTLRSEIESERALISRLKDEISDEPLRLLLQSASSTLAFALMGVLDPKAMERTRTPAELESWLSQAARYLERATQIRREVQEAAKFAPDASKA